jgi:serine/threonine protein kinase/tetratricopeptide (TPR) repeat protein
MNERDLFMAALPIEDAAERAAYLGRACAGETALRQRVEALLAAFEQAGSFLQQPVGDPRPTPDISPPGPSNGSDPAEGPGTIIGPYKLIEPIGEGGMGTVWLAQQTEPVKRLVAVKLIKAGMDSKQVIARFEAERQALALMDHPNIARVLDGGTASAGRPYFVMDLVKGVPITRYCDHNHLTPRQRLELFVSVCQAVQHAHQKGIIHRDLKPSNVLVALYDGKPVPKVIDFGVAKATGQPLTEQTLVTGFGAVVGTLEYMSPEQAEINQLDIDTRSDIYSLGVLLYELLTGSPPFTRKELASRGLLETLRVIREEEPTKPSTKLSSAEGLPTLAANRGTDPAKLMKLVRGELDWIVMKALEKDRSRRYETANGLAMDVQRHLVDEPVAAGPPSVRYRLRKFVRRNKGPVLATSFLVLALLGGIIGTSVGLVRADRARAAEAEQRDAAVASAEEERKARETAQKRLAQIKRTNKILCSIFADLNPADEEKGGLSLRAQLGERLGRAAALLEGDAIDDPVTAAVLQGDLGELLRNLGYPKQALELLTKARPTIEAHFNPDDPTTLVTLNRLALAYKATGQLDKALPLFEQVLERSARLRPDHLDTLTYMNNLATAYLAARRFDKAVPLAELAVEKQQALLGLDDPLTLLSMNNLAVTYKTTGRLDKALPLLLRTLELTQAKHGPDHLDTILSLSNLGTAYLSAKQLDKAVPLLERTLERSRTNLGPNHPVTLRSMSNLATAYKDLGKPDQAVSLLEQALHGLQGKLGADHPDVLLIASHLVKTYLAADQFDKAMPLGLTTLEKRRAQLGPAHRDTYFLTADLAQAYQNRGQFDKADRLLQEALSLVQQQGGRDSTTAGWLLGVLGMSQLRQKKYAQAEALFWECLEIRAKREPEEWGRFYTMSLLGSSLLGQKKYPEAEPHLLRGYEGMKKREAKMPGPARGPRLTEALDWLVQLYDAWDKRDEAMKWRKELEAHKRKEAGVRTEKSDQRP